MVRIESILVNFESFRDRITGDIDAARSPLRLDQVACRISLVELVLTYVALWRLYDLFTQRKFALLRLNTFKKETCRN